MSTRIRRATLRITPPTYEQRLTIPAREALERAGNLVESWSHARAVDDLDTRDLPPSALRMMDVTVYRITLVGTLPRGLVQCLIGHDAEQHRGLRMTDEPAYPDEWPRGVAWHEQGQWVPCPAPRCDRALVWYEAGYVPGYRVCTTGHHAQLRDDGITARAVRGVS